MNGPGALDVAPAATATAGASTDRLDFDAVIVGAGPAGASAACLLARAGWSVALVEKQRFPRRKVCGECIAASNLPLLDALGIGAAFDAAAGPALTRVALLHGADEVVADLPAAADARHRYGRALGRETLDALLLAQARRAGAQVFQPWSVQSVDGGVGAWRVGLRSGIDADARAPGGSNHGASPERDVTLTARVAIAAHGSWESLPSERSARRAVCRSSDLFAFKANFNGATLAAGVLPVLAFDGGYGGMVLADGGTVTLACCVRRDRLDALRRAAPGERAGDVVEAWLRHTTAGVRRALDGATRDGPWLAAGPLDPGVRVRDGDAMFRIGNAAGEAHPIIGEGMSMAMQSAWLLCAELLREAGAMPRGVRPGDDAGWQRAAARRYAAQWRREFAPRLRLAAAFAHLAMRPWGAAALLGAAGAWPGLLTAGAGWVGKARCAADAATMNRLSRP